MGFFSKLTDLFKGKPGSPAPAEQSAPAAPAAGANWQKELTLTLRAAEPRLSEWLKAALAGVETRGELLRERLLFLFAALEAPAEEARQFVDRFEAWLDTMEYERLEDFRSELQYRLAWPWTWRTRRRALPAHAQARRRPGETKERITRRIDGLLSNRAALTRPSGRSWRRSSSWPTAAWRRSPADRAVRDRVRRERARPEDFKPILREELTEVFTPAKRITALNPPEVVLMIGVNGVGKTTTIAKLAHRATMQGKKVLIAAGDTFRAAAMEQLQIWADRVGAGFYAKGEGADPAAVAFEAVDAALRGGYDILFVDTAGPLHTKTNLMEELKKIRRCWARSTPGLPTAACCGGRHHRPETPSPRPSSSPSGGRGRDRAHQAGRHGQGRGGGGHRHAVRAPHHLRGPGEKMEDRAPSPAATSPRPMVGE
jgi:fused signal recognition particle receptor